MQGEPFMVGLVATLLKPRFRATTRTDIWVKRAFKGVVGALWSVIEFLQMLIRLIYLPGAPAPATTTTTIAPTTLLHAQQNTSEEKILPQQTMEEELQVPHTVEEQLQSTGEEELQMLQITEEELQSQQATEEEDQAPTREEVPPQLTTEWQHQSTAEDELEPLQKTEEDHQSQEATEEGDQSPIREELAPQQTTEDEPHLQQKTESKLQSTMEEELQPQQTVTETLQPQQAVKDELQYEQMLGVELQPQQIIKEKFRSNLQSAEDEELLPRHSATEEGLNVAILKMISLLRDLWNGKSLKKGKRHMKACFKQINLPSPFLTTRSQSACNSSSPSHYKYDNGFSSVNHETNNLFHPFKSLFSLYHGGVHFIDHSSLSKVDGMILKFQIVGLGYQKILYKIIEDNSDFLGRFFCDYFKSADLSIDLWSYTDASQFTCKSAKKCVRTLKIATSLLRFIGHELAEANCILFDQDLRNYYFSVCARRPIEDLIEAADSISNLNWSADHIYQMLILFEAIADVLKAFDYPVRSDRIFQQMRANFKGVFDGIKCLIRQKLDGSQFGIMPVRHPVTNILIEYMKLFKNHSSTIKDIFVGDRCNTLSRLLSEVISFWAEELEKQSVPDTQGSTYIFLLNNLTYFILEITSLLEVLTPNDCAEILQPLKSRVNEYFLKYLEKYWGPVRDLMELKSGVKPCLSLLVEFISRFNGICNSQRSWVLQTKLKKKLQNKIKGFIIPPYEAYLKELLKMTPSHETFLEELQKRFVCVRLPFYQVAEYKTPIELAITLEGLFESEYNEQITSA